MELSSPRTNTHNPGTYPVSVYLNVLFPGNKTAAQGIKRACLWQVIQHLVVEPGLEPSPPALYPTVLHFPPPQFFTFYCADPT